MSEDWDKLKDIHISSFDEEEEENEEVQVKDNGDVDSSDYTEFDEFDDDDEDGDEIPITLGFLEKPKNNWSLLRQLFPSKAGGVPAWLEPINLPSGRSSLCDICSEPLQFLLQVYAPFSDKDYAFHRTLFVFMCPSMTCLNQDQHEQWKRLPEKASRSVKVFRSQLTRSNPFYSKEAPKYNGTDEPSIIGASLCNWCGTWKGDKVCSSCRKTRYCSEKHQSLHWKSGHKIDCCQLDAASQSSSCTGNKTTWPQFEIINEDEVLEEEEEEEGLNNSLVVGSKIDESVNSMLHDFEGDADKQSWVSFQDRIGRAPEQIMRYCRHEKAKPLWPMHSGRPSKADIPNCSSCGGPRAFEFQILPQLLYYFGVKNDVDSLDWASIVVYTCENSCEGSSSYKEEFSWVQLASQTTTTTTV
ncbi:programmed cell death protein 2 [Impatiens glandulifera]|uniref:programmed cell death protein 2 n=1 Tax=Impatiens glandulifera TaxID=253017 RepID=UPI001FB0D6B7|nr:programmed cell death protein 2 [Impatiens glandulifera]